jgi:hypothetical protein
VTYYKTDFRLRRELAVDDKRWIFRTHEKIYIFVDFLIHLNKDTINYSFSYFISNFKWFQQHLIKQLFRLKSVVISFYILYIRQQRWFQLEM